MRHHDQGDKPTRADRGRDVGWRLALVLFAGAPAIVSLGGCSGIFDPQGPIGRAELKILLNALAIMLAVGAPTIIATLVFAYWFRSSNHRAKYMPHWAYSGRLEVIVWVIPALVVMFLGGIAWIGSHDLDPYKPLKHDLPPVEVQVVSMDWKWLFIYPEQGVATVNALYVPAGRPIHFRLTSSTVMNSFFIPQLGTQIYTMAGMTTELSLLADGPGVYRGISAQFSGDGFSDMNFKVYSLRESEFEVWIEKTRAATDKLDSSTYRSLSKPGIERTPKIFGDIEDSLFDEIVATSKDVDVCKSPSIGAVQKTARQTTLEN
jgi:cytochrome o ubiquinol oxidase subunit 2